MKKINIKKIIISILIIVIVGAFTFGIFYLFKNYIDLKNKYFKLETSIGELENNTYTFYSNTEIETYKQMVNNLEYSNEKILNTIYYALSGIAFAFFAIIGANVFLNFRFNKEEIENIKQNNNLKIEEIKNKYLQMIQSELKNFEEISNAKIKENFDSLLNDIKSQIKIYSDNFSNQIKTNKDVADNQYAEIQEMFEPIRKELKSKTSDIDKIILIKEKKTQIELAGLEAEIWSLKEVPSNALTGFIEKANLEIELDMSLELSLQRIIEALKKMRYIATWDFSRITGLLDKIPSEYRLHKEEIENVVKTMKKE